VKPEFERLAVIGLGLLGGSVAAAAKRANVARQVVGASRSRDARAWALRQGWVDTAGEAREVVSGADLVVLATPVFAMGDVLAELAPVLRTGAIVTDVGSVKSPLAETLPGMLPSGVNYVGSHPMAGGHHSGVEHARADLFESFACVVTGGSAPARQRVCRFWQALGARVVERSAADHDAQVAWTSHVPHILAFAFASAFSESPSGAREVTGGGFRDFTRIALSDPELWGDILTANRKAIAAPLGAVGKAISELGRAVEANDPEAVERCISSARDALALVESPSLHARQGAEGQPLDSITQPRLPGDTAGFKSEDDNQ
jgi:cyclohexadieny/prephenate dehydrogenase